MNDPEFVATELMMREIIRNRNGIKCEGFVFAKETIASFPRHEEVVRKCHKLATPFRLKWCGWSVTVVGMYYYLPVNANNDWRWLGSVYLAYRINRKKQLRISAWGCFPFAELVRFYEFLLSNIERRIK